MTKHQEKVRKLNQLAGQPITEKPHVPSKEIRYLRARLILEECLEAIEALGCKIINKVDTSKDDWYFLDISDEVIESDQIDINEVAKELADVSVVAEAGTGDAFGLDMEPIIDAVDENNLAKFGPGGYRRDDGKWVKPPNHPKPNLKEIIEKQSL